MSKIADSTHDKIGYNNNSSGTEGFPQKGEGIGILKKKRVKGSQTKRKGERIEATARLYKAGGEAQKQRKEQPINKKERFS